MRPLCFLCLVSLAPVFLVADDRLAVPDSQSQEKALALVKEVLGEEWDDAKDDAQKRVFARKLLGKATQSTNPANKFVLLRSACDVATQAGDGMIAYQSIEEMHKAFQVDSLLMKASSLFALSRQAKSRSEHLSVARETSSLMDVAIARDSYDVAGKLAEMALAEARKARDAELVAKVVARRKEVNEFAVAYSATKGTLAKLNDDPTNSDANSILADYFCFVKGNWKEGLPMLALGNDAELKRVAILELNGSENTETALALGDGWWELAEMRDQETFKIQVRGRAAYWYRKSLPNITGLTLDKVTKRIKLAEESRFQSGRHVLLEAGQPDETLDLGNWTRGDGFVEGRNRLHFRNTLNHEDFRLEMKISLSPFGSMASGIGLYSESGSRGWFGFDGRTTNYFSEGKLFGKLSQGKSSSNDIQNGVPFRFVVERAGPLLRSYVNGNLVHERELKEMKLSGFDAGSVRANVRLYDVVLTKW